jgi:AraC-like DNA-binding protein
MQRKTITVTNGFVIDSTLLTECEWDELEQQLNNRELSLDDLAEKLGLSKRELDAQLTHTETQILDC